MSVYLPFVDGSDIYVHFQFSNNMQILGYPYHCLCGHLQLAATPAFVHVRQSGWFLLNQPLQFSPNFSISIYMNRQNQKYAPWIANAVRMHCTRIVQYALRRENVFCGCNVLNAQSKYPTRTCFLLFSSRISAELQYVANCILFGNCIRLQY